MAQVDGIAQAPAGPPLGVDKIIPIGAEDLVTLAGGALLVRILAEDDCHIAFGSSVSDTPAATTDHMKMLAGRSEYFGVVPGSKISAIAAA
jgi:hypothetical protein